MHWCKREILCSPKTEGGLGFRSFKDFNLALLAKQAWRLLSSPDALWSRLLRGLYFPRGNFLSTKKGSRASWIWASLWEAKKVIEMGTVKVIGSGEETWVDKDPWVPTLQKGTIGSGPQNHIRVKEWIEPGERIWNSNLIQGNVTEDELEAILRIPIGEEDSEDFWAWKFNNEGNFTVKSAYHAIHETNTITAPPGNSEKWKWIWSLQLPPKLIFFIWRCAKNGIATKERLWHRKCSPDATCPVCQNQLESIVHCMFECQHALSSWNNIFPSLPLPPQSTTFFDWFCSLKDSVQPNSLILIVYLCWNIWKARNERAFKNRIPWPPNTCRQTVREFTEWTSCPRLSQPHVQTSSVQLRDNLPHPSPPPSNHHMVIHCDGSFISDSQPAAYGVVVINHHGQVCDGRADILLCSTPFEAEAKALLEGLKLAQEYGGECIVQSDCLNLVQALRQDKAGWPWRGAAWMGSMKSILQASNRIEVRFVHRKFNARADWVARSLARNSLPDDWISILDLISDFL
ncbi:unnamed protein product [Linum trigynum]|uniref:Uncharacterized protein n=1 Tax=Linum trigynum TaxID=586398 RepID=A0AAV2EDZ9_9ROSI